MKSKTKFYFIFSLLLMVAALNIALAQASTQVSASQQGRVMLDSDSDGTNAQGNVETEFKVEKGEKADGGDPDGPVINGQAAVEAKAKESGEKAGTQDINIGVGELLEVQSSGERVMQPEYGTDQQAEQPDNQAHNRQSDLDFLKARADIVAVSAAEVRGWDPEKKQQLMAEVKNQAEVNSEQDLEHFAQGVLLENGQLESIAINYGEIRARHRQKAKFLGLFDTEIKQETTVTFGDGESGRVPQQVKVKFPWYRFLFQVDSNTSAAGLQEQLQAEFSSQTSADASAGLEAASELSAYAKATLALSNVLHIGK